MGGLRPTEGRGRRTRGWSPGPGAGRDQTSAACRSDLACRHLAAPAPDEGHRARVVVPRNLATRTTCLAATRCGSTLRAVAPRSAGQTVETWQHSVGVSTGFETLDLKACQLKLREPTVSRDVVGPQCVRVWCLEPGRISETLHFHVVGRGCGLVSAGVGLV